MVSVTSEVSANTSFQNAAAKSARPDSDPPAGNDSFAALVDSNTAASRNDNRAQDQAPAPRRSDDAQASSNRSRDNAAASDKADKAARSDSNDRNAADKTRNDKARSDKARNDDNVRDDGNADAKTDAVADADTKAATTRRAKSKSDAPKSDKVDPDEIALASSGELSAAGQTDTSQDATTVTTADAIAAAIPATATPAPATPVAPATDKAAAPLAIAAAAIAASASVAAETAPAASDAAASDTATTATTSPANTAQADAKTTAQATLGQAISTQATTTDPSVTTGAAQAAASLVAATPAATKSAAPPKSPEIAKKSTATAVEQQPATIDSTDTDTSATPAADTIVPAVTSPTEAGAKPKSENGIAEAVKADTSGNSIIPPVTHANANAHLAANIGQTPVNASGNGLPAVGTIPTQQPTAHVAAPAAASQLTATAATDAAVPVSGLAMEIAASARSGKTRFEIRLDPAELGRIDVRIDVDRHGQVTSHLTVERPETLSMLRQDANQLQRALDNAGLSTGNGGLQFSLRDQSSQGQNDGNQGNPNAHRIVVSEEDSVPAIVAGRSYGRMLGASGGVDIRV